MGWRVLFLDLDDTLYAPGSGVWQAIGERIQSFVIERLHVTPEEATRLRRRYFEQYGTTLNGLWLHHRIDPSDYLAYVHDLPLQDMLVPDPILRSMLAALSQKRIVFTNADRRHAERVLACLGIADQIDSIIDLFALQMMNKPEPEAYARALALSGESEAKACVIVDDLPRNLVPAKAMGMTTVLVGASPENGTADHYIAHITELTSALPGLARAERG